VHNDFHETDGIFPLFNGLCVKDIDNPFEPELNSSNLHMANGTNEVENGNRMVEANGHREG
jgi:methylenetetrahydrofolate reductase (NADPH)